MPKLTFIMFGRNDADQEELKVGLSIDSLLDQSVEDYNILFYDLSPDNLFSLPRHNKLIVKYLPLGFDEEFSPAYYRNLGALEADGEYICHTNTDCIFAHNFVETLLAHLGKNIMVCCRRKYGTREDTEKITTLENARKLGASKTPKLQGKQACGECQCLQKEWFIKNGGYHKCINAGKSIPPKDTIYREDTMLSNLVNGTKGMKIYWANDKTWILHLFHYKRTAKKVYMLKRGIKQGGKK
ncbi:glycosyltransferase [Patescibacteria group bacterium]|nr:glycosyltransferase [Patescibacteria group bacterium]